MPLCLQFAITDQGRFPHGWTLTLHGLFYSRQFKVCLHSPLDRTSYKHRTFSEFATLRYLLYMYIKKMEAENSKIQTEVAVFFRALLSYVLPDLLRNVDGSSKVDEVKTALRVISQKYRMGLSQASTRYRSDWEKATNRAAYVFLYLLQHCNLVCYALLQSTDLRAGYGDWVYRKKLKVCCVGGGPGSDLVGLDTFLRQTYASPPMLDCLVLDLYPSWKKAWDTIAYYLPRHLRVRYKRCNLVTDAGLTNEIHQFVVEADLITLVKSFSAVAAFLRADKSQGSTLRAILRNIKPGCHVLYIDNDHDGDSEFRNGFATPAGLELVFEKRGYQYVPRGSYSDTVRRYCTALDFNPMRGCDVNIQLYCKKEEKRLDNGRVNVQKTGNLSMSCCDVFLFGFLCIVLYFSVLAFYGFIIYGLFRLVYWLLCHQFPTKCASKLRT